MCHKYLEGAECIIQVPKGVGDFYIETNYSEQRAAIKSYTCDFEKQLAVVFSSKLEAKA